MGSRTAKTEAPLTAGPSHGDASPASRPIAVRLRAAGPRDAAALAHLRHQADAVHARLLPDYFQTSLVPESTKRSPVGPESVILVAEEVAEGQGKPGRGVLGYVSARLVDTPASPTMTPRRRAHVEAIVVEEAQRGRGIGTALMRGAAAWAARHEAAELVLTVWSENRAAEALYRSLGYQPIARILRREID